MNRFVLLISLLACCYVAAVCVAQEEGDPFATEAKPRSTLPKHSRRPSQENDDPFANGPEPSAASSKDSQVPCEEKAIVDPCGTPGSPGFLCDSRRSGLVFSLSDNRDACDIEVIYDPKKKQELRIAFLRDGKRLVEVRGHLQSVFKVSEDNRLYFVEYFPNRRGCAVVAYDLSNGKMLWRTPLRGAKGKETGIVECVNLFVGDNGEGIGLSCREADGKFLAGLDRATGAELNHRVCAGEDAPLRGPLGGTAPPPLPGAVPPAP